MKFFFKSVVGFCLAQPPARFKLLICISFFSTDVSGKDEDANESVPGNFHEI